MKRGFTLIELLVVVLIIGILSAAALPMYEKATRKAHFVQVQTTLTALMRDIDVYTMENGYDAQMFTQLTQSVSCNTLGTGISHVEICYKDEGDYWTSRQGSTINLGFHPNSSLFLGATDKDAYSFSKSMGTNWTWTNAGNNGTGFFAFATDNSETLQLFCDWWIKQGGRPVSGSAKTLADANCK